MADPAVGSIYGPRYHQMALDRIAAADKKGGWILDLSGLGLLGIPHEVFSLVNLQYFSVNRNQLSILPPEIGDLKRLRDLNLSDDHLASLLPDIGQLKQIERRFLSGNWLSSLPPELADLAPLRVLSLLRNPLPDPYRSLVSSRPTLTARNVLSLLREQETIQSTVDEDQSPEIPDQPQAQHLSRLNRDMNWSRQG
jgi:Leucine-rich repeat (LRR) protein